MRGAAGHPGTFRRGCPPDVQSGVHDHHYGALLVSVFFSRNQYLLISCFVDCRRDRSGVRRPRLAEGYLLMSIALLITSGEAARIVSLIAWVSEPDLGSISTSISAACRRKSGSFTSRSKALRSAAMRSAGTPGGVMSARPIADPALMNSATFLPVGSEITSCISGTSARSLCRLRPDWMIGLTSPLVTSARFFQSVHAPLIISISPRASAIGRLAVPG